MLFLQKWSVAKAEEWYINRLWQFVLSMVGLKTNTSLALIQLITAARLLLGKNCSLTEESPLSVGNIVDCWLLPSHISPEQSRLATFPAALEASEGHFDTTVYCCFFWRFLFHCPLFLWWAMLPAALDAKDVCGLLLTFQAHCVLLMVENSEPPFSLPPFSLAGNISSCL